MVTTMTAFEELFQMTTKLGLSTISKRAPHGRWRIDVSLPNGANITGTKGTQHTCDMSVCEVDADTPEQAAELAVKRLRERLHEINDRIEEIRGRETT